MTGSKRRPATGPPFRPAYDSGDSPEYNTIYSGLDLAQPWDAQRNKMPVSVHHYGNPDDFFFKYAHGTGIHVLTADGKVRFLRTDNLTPDDFRQILQIGGCNEGARGARAIVTDVSGRRLNWPDIAALAVWLMSVGVLLTAAVRGQRSSAREPRHGGQSGIY
jgi:hypothetical protein